MSKGITFVEFEDLVDVHGQALAQTLFESFKKTKPNIPISDAFAKQVLHYLPEGLLRLDKAEWGLENEDSDSCAQWCEHYYFDIPSIEAKAFIEAGDNHYYVNLLHDDGQIFDGETLTSWTHIPDVILDFVSQIQKNIIH